MANRKAHFTQSAMYHGSDHAFQVGDTVRPGTDGVAWASTNRDVAAGYGSRVYNVEPISDVTRHSGAAKEFGIHYSSTGYKVTGVSE
jgi:hypothetical protein